MNVPPISKYSHSLQIHNAGPPVLISNLGAAHSYFSLFGQIHFCLNHSCLLIEFFPLRRQELRASTTIVSGLGLLRCQDLTVGCKVGITLWEHSMEVNSNPQAVFKETDAAEPARTGTPSLGSQIDSLPGILLESVKGNEGGCCRSEVGSRRCLDQSFRKLRE